MRILVGCLVFCFFSFNAFAQQKTVIDKVISTIGGELILLSEVEEQHALMAAQNGQLPADARCGIVENIMVSKLMLNCNKLTLV